jgi:hypothetical protein
VTYNIDNTITYTPSHDFNGADVFTYTVSDNHDGFDTASVTVTVTPVNDPPLAVDDAATTSEDTPVTIDVLDNDNDVDGDTLTVSAVGAASNGTATNNISSVAYTPAPGYVGADAFTYTVSDGKGGSDIATVTVTVTQSDLQPPSGTIQVNGGDTYARDPVVNLTLSATDNVAVTEMRLFYNNTLHNWEAYAASKSIALTGTDGIQAVSVEYMDADGNTSSTYTDTIILDTTPPSSAVDALPATQDDITFSVSWSATDATSGVSCYDVQYRDEIDGAWTGWQNCVIDSSAIFTGTAAHTYYFRSRAQDNADNWEGYPTSPDYDTFTTLPEPPHPPPVSYDVFLPLILRQ